MNNSKPILVYLIAAIVLVAVVGFATAGTGSLGVSILNVELNGVDVSGVLNGGSMNVVGFNEGTIPIEVSFTAQEDASDVRVKAWIGGHRSSLESSSSRFNMVNGSTYHQEFDLKLPSDVKDSESYTLYIRLESKTGYHEESFSIKVQRESYDLRILSVEFDNSVNAGDTLAVDVVLKNRGYERLDDTYVTVSIPELGVSKRSYFGDLTPSDEKDETDKEDAVLGRMYVNIPSDAKAGVYSVEVSAHNSDSDARVSQTLAVGGSVGSTRVIAPVMSKVVAKGSEVSYDLILVNSGSKIGVYEISAETSDGLNVRVDEPVVTVSSGSSKTVRVTVMPTSSGSKSFAVNVYKDGTLIERVPFVADVSGSSSWNGNNAVVLTVVLAIVFVVLLVILIVLLTKKPAKESEEFGESYY
ncbi:MAG: hypothetical protein AABW73_00165 [Nanoarchaeota archaeon]